MKLCKDCRWFSSESAAPPYYEYIYAKCAHPSTVSKVDGSPRLYCNERRATRFFGTCGPKGRQWEKRS